jgi:hypothetical protein
MGLILAGVGEDVEGWSFSGCPLFLENSQALEVKNE